MACIGFSIGFYIDRFAEVSEMEKRIRLACGECDTEECDGVSQIPPSWKDVREVQSQDDSLTEVSADDKQRSLFDWYTHLGLCPTCQPEGD